MDRLQAMSVFVAVAEEAGFAPAARRLNLSPPSVTRAVSELEARLGARLFHRTTRAVRLSEAGERYLADCRRILAEIEEAESHAAGIHASPAGPVSVSASVLFGRMIVAPALFDLMARYPEIEISALFVDRVVDLLGEGIDVAVRIAHLPDSSLAAIRVGAVRQVLCASPDYLRKRDRPRVPADLAGHDTIDFYNPVPGSDWTFHDSGKTWHIRPKSRLHVNNADIAIAAARAGHGIARVLSYMIAEPLRAGSLEVLLDEHEPSPLPVRVLHKESGRTSARVRAVVDFLVERLRREPAIAPSLG